MKKIIIFLVACFIGYSCTTKKRKRKQQSETTVLIAFDWNKNVIANSKALRFIEERDTIINDVDKTYLDTVYIIPVNKYDAVQKKDTTYLYYANTKAVLVDFNRAAY